MPVPLILASVDCVGVSGSRALDPGIAAAVRATLAALPPSCHLVTGCVSGVDALARARWADAHTTVFRARDYGRGRGAYAARSIAAVRHVASVPGGIWLSFPAVACPARLVPSPRPAECFRGLGSGTWASAALAVGLGLPVLAFLPAGVPPPTGWGASPVPLCLGWWQFAPLQQAKKQSSLFDLP